MLSCDGCAFVTLDPSFKTGAKSIAYNCIRGCAAMRNDAKWFKKIGQNQKKVEKIGKILKLKK